MNEVKDVVKCVYESKENILNIVANIVVAIASVFNILFVAWFYFRDKKENKQIRKNEYKLSWFNSMKFNEYGFEVCKKIETFKGVVTSFKTNIRESNDTLINSGKEIDNSILSLKSDIISLLKAIDEKNISTITLAFQTVQDELINIQIDVIGLKELRKPINIEEIYKRIDNLKTLVIKSIYEAGADLF